MGWPSRFQSSDVAEEVTQTALHPGVAGPGGRRMCSAATRPIATFSQISVELWLMFSVFCVAGGWLLSAFGQMNRAGYGVLLLIWMAFSILHIRVTPVARISSAKFRKRFRGALPLLFLIIAVCSLLGGLLYPPTNYDALAYRLPRVLNWIQAEQWHWIHSGDPRLNNRAVGFEWLMTPVLLFAKSERPIFLINFLSFLLLPGLVFSVFTRLGIHRRVAWHWMWILPSGYNFMLQAGSISNDSFAAIYALAAVDYALRGRKSGRFRDFALSMLAMALVTGAKATNLPLALVWLVAAWPMLIWISRRPIVSTAIILLASSVSFLPIAVINHSHCADWTGVSLEGENVQVTNPMVGIIGNAYLLLVQNLTPPFFLPARWYGAHAAELLPKWIVQPIQQNFTGEFFDLHELPSEDGSLSGIGFGVTALLIVSFVIGGRFKGALGRGRTPSERWARTIYCVAPLIALLVVMIKSGVSCPSRLIAAYYPFLFAVCLLVTGQARLTYRRWWKVLAAAVMLLAVPVLILTPSRPLFPAKTFFAFTGQNFSGSSVVTRAERVYSVYAQRNDPLAKIRQSLPADAKVVGLVSGGNDLEVSLWRPFFERRVVHLLPEDNRETLKAKGIQVVVLNAEGLQYHHQTIVAEWCRKYNAQVYQEFSLPIRASRDEAKWYVARVLQ
jgi:hypothetical protein